MARKQNGLRQEASIIGIGELLWDILLTGPRLGGAPANFTVFCARLGHRARLVTRVGDDDFGRAAIFNLAQSSLSLEHIQIDDQHRTGTVNVTLSVENQPQYRIAEDVAWDYIAATDALKNAFRSADAVCFGTLSQRSPVSRETIRDLVAQTREECVRVCDVNVRLPYCSTDALNWSLTEATIVKVSDEELPFVLARTGTIQTSSCPPDAAQALLAAFPNIELVAITQGSRGCILANRQTTMSHPGFNIRMVDPVGAGDAFTAGLTHAILGGASLDKAAKVANLCGSFVASQPTASPLLSPAFRAQVAAELAGDSCQEQTSSMPE